LHLRQTQRLQNLDIKKNSHLLIKGNL